MTLFPKDRNDEIMRKPQDDDDFCDHFLACIVGKWNRNEKNLVKNIAMNSDERFALLVFGNYLG